MFDINALKDPYDNIIDSIQRTSLVISHCSTCLGDALTLGTPYLAYKKVNNNSLNKYFLSPNICKTLENIEDFENIILNWEEYLMDFRQNRINFLKNENLDFQYEEFNSFINTTA